MKIAPITPIQHNVWQRKRPTNEELLARFEADLQRQFKARKKVSPINHNREK